MKANELMIGDWVKVVSCPLPLKVRSVEDGKIGLCHSVLWNNSIGWTRIDVPSSTYEEDVEPIPLTDEILEANSWEKVPQPGCANPYHWQLSKYEDDKEDDAYLLYRVKVFETFFRGMLISISVPACEDISFRKQVEHVHELQHALRLCGIEKEIGL